MSPDQRFDAKWMPEPNTGCWLWTAALVTGGYGAFWINGRQDKAHRYAYERWVGPIPDGLQVDHLCRTRSCVNPFHLEAVTCRENILRGESKMAERAKQSHCGNGHEYTPENTGAVKANGRRYCRACKREDGLRRRGRLKEWTHA